MTLLDRILAVADLAIFVTPQGVQYVLEVGTSTAENVKNSIAVPGICEHNYVSREVTLEFATPAFPRNIRQPRGGSPNPPQPEPRLGAGWFGKHKSTSTFFRLGGGRMAVIHPEGLFKGDRLRRCSDSARLYWPYFFLSANGFGRFELDYQTIVRDVLVEFTARLSEEEFHALIEEYRAAHLLFLYEAAGKVWGQWYCKPNSLPRWKTRDDRESPEPPKEPYEKWLKSYVSEIRSLPKISKVFRNLPKSSEILPIGVGVGVGVEKALGLGLDCREITQKLWELHPSPSEFNFVEAAVSNEMRNSVHSPEEFSRKILDSLRLWVEYWTANKRFATGLRKWVESGDYSREPPRKTETSAAVYETLEERDARITREDAERRRQ
jgi:hypothetical protein